MLARAERLDYAYLRNSAGLTALAGGRLWLRQADRGLEPQGVAIISGRPLAEPGMTRASGFTMADVSLWRLSAADRRSPGSRRRAPGCCPAAGCWRMR